MKYLIIPTAWNRDVFSFKIEFYLNSRLVGGGLILAKKKEPNSFKVVWERVKTTDTLDGELKKFVDYNRIWADCLEMIQII